jgi:hypothetical protein
VQLNYNSASACELFGCVYVDVAEMNPNRERRKTYLANDKPGPQK